MGETLWGTQSVGDRTLIVEDDLAPGGAAVVLLPSGIPDWVRIPRDVPHADAGGRFRVREVVRGPCPAHRGEGEAHEIPILLLAGSELLVGMCATAGWCVHLYRDEP